MGMMGPGGMPGMGGMPVHPFLQQQQPQGMKATLYVEGVPSDATEREVVPTPTAVSYPCPCPCGIYSNV